MRPNDVVFVTGVGGPAGRVASGWFARRGLRVVGADMREVSSDAERFVQLPPAADPEFPRVLLDAVARSRAALLVPTVSEELPRVARLRGQVLALGCALAMGTPRSVDLAHDKLLTARVLALRGVAVPRTLPAGTERARIIGELGLPVLAKPRVGRGGRGVRVLHTAEEVLAAQEGDVIWQEFAPGEEYDVNLFVEREGAVSAARVLRKTALREGLTGNAAGVEPVDRPLVLAEAIRAVQALRLSGPLDVDVRIGRDARPLVLEINARLGANALSAPEVLEALHAAWRERRCA